MFQNLITSINANPVFFTLDEEAALHAAYLAGDIESRNILINAHLRLVLILSLEYAKKGGTLEELFNEGVLGLHRALEDFKPAKGNQFSTYATWWIRSNLQDFLRRNNRQVILPSHVVDQLTKLVTLTHKCVEENHREPTDEEIAIAIQIPLDKVERLKSHLLGAVSFNQHATAASDGCEFDTELSSVIEDIHIESARDYALRLDDIQTVRHAVAKTLSEQERTVIHRRFGLSGHPEMTLAATGAYMGVSLARVQQIEKQAIEKLSRVVLSE